MRRGVAILWFLLAPSCVAAAGDGGALTTVTADALVQLRDLDALSVSPDGKWVAFQVRQADAETNRYTLTWHVVASSGGGHHVGADAGEPIQPATQGRINGHIEAPTAVWSADSRWLTYRRKVNGRIQIWRSLPGNRRMEQLTRNEGDVRSLVYSQDGDRILFEVESHRRDVEAKLAHEGSQGFHFDRRFLPHYGFLPVAPTDASSRDPSVIDTSAQLAARRLWVFEIGARRERLATAAELNEFSSRISKTSRFGDFSALSPRGNSVWTEARNRTLQGGLAPRTIVMSKADAKDTIVCPAPECTSQLMRGVWWRGDDVIIFASGGGPTNQDTSLYTWRPGDTSTQLLLRTADKLLIQRLEWSCAIALSRLICFHEKADRPRRLVAIDLDTGNVDTLYDPNPAFGEFDLGPAPVQIRIRADSGIETRGYLVLPPRRHGADKLPLVIVTYRCGGFLRGGTGDEYPIYPIAAQGFAVFCFNVPDIDFARLAQEDWRTFSTKNHGPGDPEKHRVQKALADTVADFERAGLVDRRRIGITGLSFGAEVVAFSLFHRRPSISAAIASGASYEPSSTFLYGHAGRELLSSWGLGLPSSNRWNDLALSRNANEVRAPLLVNAADREMLLALEPIAALQSAGRAVEMYVHPDEYHIKWQPTHRLAIYNRNIDWMNFWLQGREDPAPEKVEQYKRWRAMRVKQCELFKGSDAPWYCRQ